MVVSPVNIEKEGAHFKGVGFGYQRGKKDMFDTLIYNNFMKYFIF